MEKVGAAEAASAVNALLQLSPNDQESLLEVIEDYFTLSTDDSDVSESDEDDVGATGVYTKFKATR